MEWLRSLGLRQAGRRFLSEHHRSGRDARKLNRAAGCFFDRGACFGS